MSENFVPVLKKYDESLTPDLAKDCSLSIQFSQESLTFSVFHNLLNKYLGLESIEFGKFLSRESFAEELKSYCLRHNWLGLNYTEIKIYFETLNSTLIPVPLYFEEAKQNFAGFNFSIDPNQIILSDKIHNLDAYLVYGIPGIFIRTWDQVFRNHKFFCQTSIFIDLALLFSKNSLLRKKVFVNVRKSSVDIAVTEGNKLLISNVFEFQTKEDFIYYLIFVMEQLGIHPMETELVLSGFIDKNSSLSEIIQKYVMNTTFLPRSESFKYSYLFNEIPDHYFFNLLNSRLCA